MDESMIKKLKQLLDALYWQTRFTDLQTIMGELVERYDQVHNENKKLKTEISNLRHWDAANLWRHESGMRAKLWLVYTNLRKRYAIIQSKNQSLTDRFRNLRQQHVDLIVQQCQAGHLDDSSALRLLEKVTTEAEAYRLIVLIPQATKNLQQKMDKAKLGKGVILQYLFPNMLLGQVKISMDANPDRDTFMNVETPKQ